jgi:hypothetical protein
VAAVLASVRLSEHLVAIGEEQGLEGLDAYAPLIEPYDAVEYLGDVAPNAVYLQFGEQDDAPSPEQGRDRWTPRARRRRSTSTTPASS